MMTAKIADGRDASNAVNMSLKLVIIAMRHAHHRASVYSQNRRFNAHALFYRRMIAARHAMAKCGPPICVLAIKRLGLLLRFDREKLMLGATPSSLAILIRDSNSALISSAMADLYGFVKRYEY